MPDRAPGSAPVDTITVTGRRVTGAPITIPRSLPAGPVAPGLPGRTPGDRPVRPLVTPPQPTAPPPGVDPDLVTVLVQGSRFAPPEPQKLPPVKLPQSTKRARTLLDWWRRLAPIVKRSPAGAAVAVTVTILEAMDEAIQENVAEVVVEASRPPAKVPPGNVGLSPVPPPDLIPGQKRNPFPWRRVLRRPKPIRTDQEEPLPEITVTRQRIPRPELLPVPQPRPGTGRAPGPLAQPLPVPRPSRRAEPSPFPRPFAPPRPTPAPRRFPNPTRQPFGPGLPTRQPELLPPSLTTSEATPLPLPQPGRTGPGTCRCPQTKTKRKPRKERTECSTGTYRETRRGLIKNPRARVPC